MAATAIHLKVEPIAGSHARQLAKSDRRRRINPQAGLALELLGHAIEYLTDEYVHGANWLSSDDPQVEAIQLLMRLNREIYFECPTVPTLGERVCSLLGTPLR